MAGHGGFWQLFAYPDSNAACFRPPRKDLAPDMIADYARHPRERFEREGLSDVRVYADAWVSFNGRRSQRLIDPTVDLAAAERSFAPKSWILPLSQENPQEPLARP